MSKHEAMLAFLRDRLDEDEKNIDGDWAAGDGGLHILSHPMRQRLEREVEAKRHMLGLLRADLDDPSNAMRRTWAKEIIARLALVHEHHPDFKEAWRR